MKKQMFIMGILSLIYCASCSHVVTHSNAGIPFLEEGATPVKATSIGAKYLGWGLSAPLIAAMAPIAAISWSTPWVDLPTAIDIASAPTIGMGYLMEGAIGLPSLAALFWMDKPHHSKKKKFNVPDKMLVPWGFVVDHKPCATLPRPTVTLPAKMRDYYGASSKTVSHLQESISTEIHTYKNKAMHISIPLKYGLPAILDLYLATRENTDQKCPLILMTPPTKASFAARYLAKRYSQRGFHAAVIVPNKTFLETHLTPFEIEQKFRNAVVAARIALKALSQQREIDNKNIYYLGVSAGGIFGAVLMAIEPAIKRAALILPGSDFPHIIANSNESSVTAYRQAWQKRGVGTKELAREFEKQVHTDPKKLSKYIDPQRILMFLGAWDSKVPIKTGLALHESLGYPETYLLAGNHETAALCFGFILRKSEKFFLAK